MRLAVHQYLLIFVLNILAMPEPLRSMKSEGFAGDFILEFKLRAEIESDNKPEVLAALSQLKSLHNFIDALNFSSIAYDKREIFESVYDVAMATFTSERDVALCNGIALERATCMGWVALVERILKENKPRSFIGLRCAIMTALANRDPLVIGVFIDHFGFEDVKQILLYPLPGKDTIFVRGTASKAPTVNIPDLLDYLSVFDPVHPNLSALGIVQQ